IVGDIDDEYDFDETEDNIIEESSGRWRVKAQTEIDDFNSGFGTHFSDDEYDTIGGLLLQRFGRVPKRGDRETIDDLGFEILRADSRRIHAILVTRTQVPK